MGHYDENRKFDEECRANGLYQVADKKWEPILRSPMPDPKTGEFDTVMIRVEHLTSSTFKRWTDGSKWICDTVGSGIERPEGVGMVNSSVADIKEFITTYPHPVGTFYLIVSRVRSAVEIIEANPTRDIRVLLIPD
jgi:hypothetical protein